jgi:hypothetical protein
MWMWLTDRLDRRWKRVAFVLWMPALFLSFIMFVYGLINVYYVNFAEDGYVLGCHLQLVRGRPIVLEDTFDQSDEQKTQRAYDRFHSRFSLASPYSNEARGVERSPAFIGCMSHTPSGSWWLEYPFVWAKLVGFFLWNGLVALIILPRFWRSMGSWVAMKS